MYRYYFIFGIAHTKHMIWFTAAHSCVSQPFNSVMICTHTSSQNINLLSNFMDKICSDHLRGSRSFGCSSFLWLDQTIDVASLITPVDVSEADNSDLRLCSCLHYKLLCVSYANPRWSSPTDTRTQAEQQFSALPTYLSGETGRLVTRLLLENKQKKTS